MIAYACTNGCDTVVGVTVDPNWLADEIAKRIRYDCQRGQRHWLTGRDITADPRCGDRSGRPPESRRSFSCVGSFYTALRRRRTDRARPATSAEPSSVSEAGSGTGVMVACKTAARPLTSAYHRL
jgi:hypothetical protein